jgi:NOL1/NOP2/fmu family ribosome biogenesis protein
LEIEEKGVLRWGKNEKLKVFRGDTYPWKIQDEIKLYEHDKKVLAVKNNPHKLKDIYFMRFWEQIGNIDNWRFEPNIWSSRYIDTVQIEIHKIQDEVMLDNYLRGNPIIDEWRDDYILISYNWEQIGLEYRKDNMIQNTFPKDWRRK